MSALARLKGQMVSALPDPVVYRITPILYRKQEPELARLRSFVANDTRAIDIGGWLGPWTRELARWCTEVHTFEPQPDLAAYLRRVVAGNVIVHEQAVGDVAGVVPLVIPSADHATKALASLDREVGEGAVVHQVEVVRLDDLDLTGIGFIKIDVEGREREVIEGARGLLASQHPRLLLEAEQRHIDFPLGDLFALVGDLGYSGWYLHQGRWHRLADFEIDRDQLDHVDDVTGGDYVNNFLFIADSDPSPPSLT
jgi:FkbM family methyltransferase